MHNLKALKNKNKNYSDVIPNMKNCNDQQKPWDRKTFRIQSRKEDESLLPPELCIIGISSAAPTCSASTRLPYVFTTKFQLHQFIAPHILLL